MSQRVRLLGGGLLLVNFSLLVAAGAVGLSDGVPSSFRSLAAILRFNTDGRLDARNGDVYMADAAVTYFAGQRFKSTFDIDLPTHTAIRSW